MTEFQRPQPLLEAKQTVAIAIKHQGRVQVGVALPGDRPLLTDLFLVPGYTERTDIASIFSDASAFVPGLLGILHLTDFACEDDIDAGRADYLATVQALTVEALDLRLRTNGQQIKTPAERYYSQTGGDNTREALHLVHDTQRGKNWQVKVRVLLAKAQGIGDVEMREHQTPEQLRALNAVTLPGVPLTPDKRPGNFFIRQAFTEHVKPRLEVAKLPYEGIIRNLVQGAVDGQSTTETVHQAADVPTRQSWVKK